MSLNVERGGTENFALNRELVGGYVQAFRAAAAEFQVHSELDLNVILRLPGALESGAIPQNEELESAVLAKVDEALKQLNAMREEEGKGIERELRQRMAQLKKAGEGVRLHRQAVLQTYTEKLKNRRKVWECRRVGTAHLII